MTTSRWTDFPFSPRRHRFFYGWILLAAATIGTLASTPGQTMGVGVFTDALIGALGLSRMQLANAYAIGTITSSFMLPFAGRFIDIYGCRVAIVAASIGLGASLYLMSITDRLMSWMPGEAFFAAMALVVFLFLCIRFFGQGCLAMISRVAIGKWFNHYRGRATGIGGVFVTFGFMYAPIGLNNLVFSVGWRDTLFFLAIIVGLGMAFLGWIFYRDNPEECGLEPDGVDDPEWHARMAAKVPDTHHQFERGEAARTVAFWAPSLALALHGMMFTAFTFHTTDLAAELGIPKPDAYSIFLLLPWIVVPVNFLCGWISDYIKLKWMLVVMMVTQVIGTFGLTFAGSTLGWIIFSVGYGIGGGIFGMMVTVPWPRFFGTKNLGAISGLNMSIMVFASAFGPILFSVIHEWTGAYMPVIYVSMLFPIAIGVLSLFADNPQEQYAP